MLPKKEREKYVELDAISVIASDFPWSLYSNPNGGLRINKSLFKKKNLPYFVVIGPLQVQIFFAVRFSVELSHKKEMHGNVETRK